MCNKSESIQKLAVALAKFNAEVKIIEKDATNPHFKNRYASLDTIIDDVRPLLAKHGLSVLQFPGGDGEKFTLRSMLIHESGEWIESEPLTMRPVKNDPQGIGSCNTYARRYSLSSLLSLNTGDDDDGNDASTVGNQANQNARTGSQTQRNTESRSSAPAASGGQSTVSNGLNAKSRVMNLKTEMKWDWDSLAAFASDVLKRHIGKVISDIKSEEEWKQVEEAMLISKAAAS